MKDNNDVYHQVLIDTILKQFYRVYHDLGYGFLERVYQNTLYFALLDEGLKCEVENRYKSIMMDT